eukprot:g61015.t1
MWLASGVVRGAWLAEAAYGGRSRNYDNYYDNYYGGYYDKYNGNYNNYQNNYDNHPSNYGPYHGAPRYYDYSHNTPANYYSTSYYGYGGYPYSPYAQYTHYPGDYRGGRYDQMGAYYGSYGNQNMYSNQNIYPNYSNGAKYSYQGSYQGSVLNAKIPSSLRPGYGSTYAGDQDFDYGSYTYSSGSLSRYTVPISYTLPGIEAPFTVAGLTSGLARVKDTYSSQLLRDLSATTTTVAPAASTSAGLTSGLARVKDTYSSQLLGDLSPTTTTVAPAASTSAGYVYKLPRIKGYDDQVIENVKNYLASQKSTAAAQGDDTMDDQGKADKGVSTQPAVEEEEQDDEDMADEQQNTLRDDFVYGSGYKGNPYTRMYTGENPNYGNNLFGVNTDIPADIQVAIISYLIFLGRDQVFLSLQCTG